MPAAPVATPRAQRSAIAFPRVAANKMIDPLSFADSLSFRLKTGSEDHGKRRSSRPDGWRGIAAVGPAHGSQRNSARFRPRSASAFGESSEDPLHRLCGGYR